MTMISIHDLKDKLYKKYYGSSKRVFRNSDVEKLLIMSSDLHYLSELYTRTRLVPSNVEFLHKKAIPAFNNAVTRFKNRYPNIKEFQEYKQIEI